MGNFDEEIAANLERAGTNLQVAGELLHDRHKQIHQDDIRFELFGQADRYQPVVCFTNDLDIVCFCQERFDSSTDNVMVVDN